MIVVDLEIEKTENQNVKKELDLEEEMDREGEVGTVLEGVIEMGLGEGIGLADFPEAREDLKNVMIQEDGVEKIDLRKVFTLTKRKISLAVEVQNVLPIEDVLEKEGIKSFNFLIK